MFVRDARPKKNESIVMVTNTRMQVMYQIHVPNHYRNHTLILSGAPNFNVWKTSVTCISWFLFGFDYSPADILLRHTKKTGAY